MTDSIPYGLCHCGCGQQTNLAPKKNTRRGWVKGEPLRYITGHNVPHQRSGIVPADYEIVDRGYRTPCWVMLIGLRPDGYSRIGYGGDRRYAHCVMYEQAIGPIPDGMEIDHLCRTRSCVNPDHLEAVLPRVNMRRSSRTKLTREIAAAVKADPRSTAEIRRDYGITASHIYLIKHGYCWKDV